jgi:hypothetical protein
MRVLILGNGSTEFQNGVLIYLEAKAQKKEVWFCDYTTTSDEAIIGKVAALCPDWVFITGIRSVSYALMTLLRKEHKLFVWDADAVNADRNQIWKERAGLPTVIVNSTMDVVQRYKSLAKRIEWVPQYFDHEYFSSSLTRLSPKQEVYDVTFLGNSDNDPQRIEWLRRLKMEGFNCCFRGSHRAVDGSSVHVYGSPMANIYKQSKIVIDIKRCLFDYGDFSTSDRLYKAMGCGAFYLTFTIPKLEELFTPGEHLVCYSSYDDMVAKIRFYLKYEDDREGIAAAGSAAVHACHLLKHRIEQYWSLMETS